MCFLSLQVSSTADKSFYLLNYQGLLSNFLQPDLAVLLTFLVAGGNLTETEAVFIIFLSLQLID